MTAVRDCQAAFERSLCGDLTDFAALKRLREAFRSCWEAQVEQGAHAGGGVDACRRLCGPADELIRGVARGFFGDGESAAASPIPALVALGGYGRRELLPASDIDVLVLFERVPDATAQEPARDFLRALWDLDCGIAPLTHAVSQVREVCEADTVTATTLLSARPLWGPPRVFSGLEEELHAYLRERHEVFIRAKFHERARKRAFFEDTVCLKEPQIREARGGMRDFQVAALVERVLDLMPKRRRGASLFADRLRGEAETAYEFLLAVRYALHRVNRRDRYVKHDTLDLHSHARVAELLGYAPVGSGPVSDFMRDYYRAARAIDDYARAVERRYDRATERSQRARRRGKFFVELFQGLFGEGTRQLLLARSIREDSYRDPLAVFELFEAVARDDVDLDQAVIWQIHHFRHQYPPEFRRDGELSRRFLALLQSPQGAARALAAMNDSGFLGEWIPEWSAIEGLFRLDPFHHFTVDAHTLATIAALESWSAPGAGSSLKHRLLARTEDPLCVKLALLLHDIGKGKGADHEAAARVLIPTVLGRLAVSEQVGRRVLWLVEEHRTMSGLSRRRNLNDPAVIEEFARKVGSNEALDQLFLVSCADLAGVGRHTLTGWQESLLEDLREKTARRLEGAAPDPGRVAETLAARGAEAPWAREALRRAVEAHVARFAPRYRLELSAEEIAEHLDLLASWEQGASAVRFAPEGERGAAALLIATRRGAPLSLLAGLCTLHGASIVSAEVHTRDDDLAICRLVVVGQLHEMPPEDFETRMREDIPRALAGEFSVARALQARRRRYRADAPAPLSDPPSVQASNRIARDHTVFDVIARDRPGLLHDLCACFDAHGTRVGFAKITTRKETVYDSFSVRTEHGALADTQISALEQALRALVAETPSEP